MSRTTSAPAAAFAFDLPSAAMPSGSRPAAGVPYVLIERGIARGRELRGEAFRQALRQLYRFLVVGCSLRVLRLSGETAGQRHACC